MWESQLGRAGKGQALVYGPPAAHGHYIRPASQRLASPNRPGARTSSKTTHQPKALHSRGLPQTHGGGPFKRPAPLSQHHGRFPLSNSSSAST